MSGYYTYRLRILSQTSVVWYLCASILLCCVPADFPAATLALGLAVKESLPGEPCFFCRLGSIISARVLSRLGGFSLG